MGEECQGTKSLRAIARCGAAGHHDQRRDRG